MRAEIQQDHGVNHDSTAYKVGRVAGFVFIAVLVLLIVRWIRRR